MTPDQTFRVAKIIQPTPEQKTTFLPFKEAVAGFDPINNSLAQRVCLSKSVVISEALAKMGLRQFTCFAAGGTSIVLGLPNHQVMRLRIKGPGHRVKWLSQLQPIETGDLPGLSYEILPAPTEKPTQAAWERLIDNIAGTKYKVTQTDISIEKGDILALPDGTAIAVDIDAMKNDPPYTYAPEADLKRDGEWVVPSKKKTIFSQLPAGYISKQEYYYPAITDHRTRGVLLDGDREQLERGEFETLRRRKPECFIMLVKDKAEMPPEEQKLTETEDGLKQLYAMHEHDRKDYFFQVRQSMMKDYVRMVFDEGIYPEQAMQELQQQQGKKKDRHDISHVGQLSKPLSDTMPFGNGSRHDNYRMF